MDLHAWTALAAFSATILAVITGIIDRSVAALVGAAVMVWAGAITEVEAFLSVDWNVIVTLLSVWVLAGYFGRTGIPEWMAARAVRLSHGRPSALLLILCALAGILSILIDNVVVILMLAPVALPIVRGLELPLVPALLMIGFCANFMGAPLLLGDLPPQLLHSVSGAEFLDFIWQFGRPSSFPILLVTFAGTLAVLYGAGFRALRPRAIPVVAAVALEPREAANPGPRMPADGPIRDRAFALVVLIAFLATLVAMAFRQGLGVKLGFIAASGALSLIVVLEGFGGRSTRPAFAEVVGELDWRVVFFYVGLFALVGGLEKNGLFDHLAAQLAPLFARDPTLGATLLYWVTVPIVGVVEHDAYILTFLHTIGDLSEQGVEPWPLWWMLLWSGTLGSNLTVAGAPALYAVTSFCEREEGRRVRLGEFLTWSVPFVLVSSGICYALGLLVWVLPYAR